MHYTVVEWKTPGGTRGPETTQARLERGPRSGQLTSLRLGYAPFSSFKKHRVQRTDTTHKMDFLRKKKSRAAGLEGESRGRRGRSGRFT